MRFTFKFFFFLFFIGIIAIQFIEVDRTNPPVTAEVKAPAEVKTILKNSCYDCHSNETKWPWYSYVAPVSWYIENDVKTGREVLNFSEWENLTSKEQAKKKDKIWEEISEDEMPTSGYIYLHPTAKLELPQKNTIKKWLDNSSNIFSY